MLENSLTKDKIINEFQKKAKDTGSSEVQIALLTKRINSLTEHFKNNKKDNHSREGMIKLISAANTINRGGGEESPAG